MEELQLLELTWGEDGVEELQLLELESKGSCWIQLGGGARGMIGEPVNSRHGKEEHS